MDYKNMTFGEFIIQKRKERDMSARQLAHSLKISAVYMCDIEKGRKSPDSDGFLDNLRETLALSEEEADIMYDLVAVARNSVSPDLPRYIMENELVRAALRTAKKNQASDEKWIKFIKEVTLERGSVE